MSASLPNSSKITDPATRNYRMRQYSKLNSEVAKLSIPEDYELTYDRFGHSLEVLTKTIDDLVLQCDEFDQNFFKDLYFKEKLTIKYNEGLTLLTFKNNALSESEITNLSRSINNISISGQIFRLSFGNSKETEIFLLTKRFFQFNGLRFDCSNCLKINFSKDFFNISFYVNSSDSIIYKIQDKLVDFYNDHQVFNINIQVVYDDIWEDKGNKLLASDIKNESNILNCLPPSSSAPIQRNRKSLSDHDSTSISRRRRRGLIIDGQMVDNKQRSIKTPDEIKNLLDIN